ncbi:nucleocapsid protein [Odonatan anphe-related virus OKIAV59]|uniref:Nucleocapsid protein n=1 Tax=Odonatan anphe-related virus OKIAV59 TaxID=2746375 RepID=A0AAE7IEX3_9MONO|nr:nucleocapsid protein [Odonatan anphe-related virus OKIAV59]QMP82148.1 nucleocapsid protein [Odonatan anphe-related virus OKIAV59]
MSSSPSPILIRALLVDKYPENTSPVPCKLSDNLYVDTVVDTSTNTVYVLKSASGSLKDWYAPPGTILHQLQSQITVDLEVQSSELPDDQPEQYFYPTIESARGYFSRRDPCSLSTTNETDVLAGMSILIPESLAKIITESTSSTSWYILTPNPSDTILKKCTALHAKLLGFVGLASAFKVSGGESTWSAKRIQAILAALGKPTDPLPIAIGPVPIKIRNMLRSTTRIKRGIVSWMTTNEDTEGIVDRTIKRQLQMIGQYSEMSLIREAVIFARDADTFAHTYLEVVKESKALIEAEEKLRRDHKDMYPYLRFVDTVVPELEASRYPALCYCTDQYLRTGDTWANFTYGGQVPKNADKYVKAVKMPLPKLDTLPGLDHVVIDFLSERHVDISKLQPAAPPQNILEQLLVQMRQINNGRQNAAHEPL